MYTIKDMYDLNETIAAELFKDKKYPWEVLGEISDFIMKLGPSLPKDEFDHPAEDIWIHKSVTIAKTATLNGPLIIDADTEVRPGAFIRGKAIVGKKCVVGNSTELKKCCFVQCCSGSALQLCWRQYFEHILIWEQVNYLT
ncbi:MAG: hypothetical protein ACLT2Z_07595 [Eubacterium sp.]